ncbi:transmembrane and coiled-coil domains protein 1-like isoform X2 [Kryptolebias marmoratus]|nr:transmembrane and coiled-coil domains protein 1-like isoform X2 [Kryptolebias marmoratus]
MHAIQEDEDDEGSSTSDPGEMQSGTENDCVTPAEELVGSRDNDSDDQASGFDEMFDEIQGIQEVQGHLKKSLEILKINHQRDHMVILGALQEDKLRCDTLEQELSDLTELHQKEISNLKEELISTKEKIDYTHHERTDFQEAIEACYSRLLKMELQQQQAACTEREEDTIPRTLLGKLSSVLLAVLSAILIFVSMVSQFVILLKPSGQMLSALFFAVVLYFIWKYRDVILENSFFPVLSIP